MTRWISHVAVLTVILTASLPAQAQPPGYPQPVGAARIPDPLGYTPKRPPPDVVPGPITPDIAPHGPPPELSLPADHTSAFQCEQFPTEEAWFSSIGVMSLQRTRLPRQQIVFREVGNTDLSPTQFYPTLPASARPVLFDLASLRPNLNAGVRASIGYLIGNQAVELSGWWVGNNDVSNTTVGQGNLTVPFGTVSSRNIPVGFEGNNGLWVNADVVTTSFKHETGNAELNYRTWNTGVDHTELIFGLRYLHAQESVNVFTNDEAFLLNAQGALDPRLSATYTATSRNNIIALQVGGECSCPVPVPVLRKFLWFTLMGKAGIGPNIIERRYKLTRGDGLQGFNVSDQEFRLGQVYEANAFLDFHILERLRFRTGYQALWAVGVSEAGAEINYNFTTQGRDRADYRSMFLHGVMAELQFLF